MLHVSRQPRIDWLKRRFAWKAAVLPARVNNNRVVRALRNAAREASAVVRGTTATHRRLRDHLVAIALATLGVDLLCGLLAFLLERHAAQTEIKTLGSALFWTTTQLLTVSSSFKNPVSLGGRMLDVFMEAYAILVIGALAGAFGAFVQKRGLELDAKG
jgi:hypothetical protein